VRTLLISATAALTLLATPSRLYAQDSTTAAQRQGVAELLAIHKADRRAHFDRDVAAMVGQIGPELLDVRDGRVTRLPRDSVRAHFAAYFRTAKFLAWDDLEPPVVEVSPDGQNAWMVVRTRIAYDETNAAGTTVPHQSTEAWMSAYHKRAGRWVLVAVTSTEGTRR
jgi:hypothetical protein